MNGTAKTAIIISVSSDIGLALAERWTKQGTQVFGTYRTFSDALSKTEHTGVRLFECDLADARSIHRSCTALGTSTAGWDYLVLAAGLLEPIGKFEELDFDAWDNSLRVNLNAQLRVVHRLLPFRNKNAAKHPCVLFFAGGGLNKATVGYSAYSLSKIALIKMCELLDAEIPDVRFVILGPGIVRTKIHTATINAGDRAGDNFERVKNLTDNDCVPMNKVLDCCDWIVEAPHDIVGGRNFSVVHDKWGTAEFEEQLKQNINMHKLRRNENASNK